MIYEINKLYIWVFIRQGNTHFESILLPVQYIKGVEHARVDTNYLRLGAENAKLKAMLLLTQKTNTGI